MRDARCRRCADARTRSLLPRPCTEWLPPPHLHAAAHARHSSRSPSQRSKPLMCSLDCSACCRDGAAPVAGGQLKLGTLPLRRAKHNRHDVTSSVQREQATASTPTSSQVSLHDERNSPPAARSMLAHEASTLTRCCLSTVLSPRCCCNSCCWPLVWQCCSTRPAPPHCSLLPSRALLSAGQSGLLCDAAPRQSHRGHSSSPIRSVATTPARTCPNLRVVAPPQPLTRIDHTAGLGWVCCAGHLRCLSAAFGLRKLLFLRRLKSGRVSARPRHAAQQEPSSVMLLLIRRRSCPTLLCCAAAVRLADLLRQPSDQLAMPPSPTRSHSRQHCCTPNKEKRH